VDRANSCRLESAHAEFGTVRTSVEEGQAAAGKSVLVINSIILCEKYETMNAMRTRAIGRNLRGLK
jgi:hypothetical protein